MSNCIVFGLFVLHRNATNRLDKLVKELDKEVRLHYPHYVSL